MSQTQIFWAFAIALTVGALLNVLQPMLAEMAGAGRKARRVPILVGIAIPLLTLAIYFAVGRPDLILPKPAAASSEVPHPASIPDLIERLEAQLSQQPDDAEAAILLARSYYAAVRIEQALPAFERAFALREPSAPLLADYADALTAQNDGAFNSQAQQAIERALALDPRHVKSLWLAGSFAFNDQRPADAIPYWTRLVPLLPEGSGELGRLQSNLREARSQSTSGAVATSSNNTISGTVAIAPELANALRDGGTLYVFARSLNGAPMPLAVMKTVPTRWPVMFTLDESMAVMGGPSLNDQRKVRIAARVSRSGQAIGQPGDIESESVVVPLGAEGVQLVLDTIKK